MPNQAANADIDFPSLGAAPNYYHWGRGVLASRSNDERSELRSLICITSAAFQIYNSDMLPSCHSYNFLNLRNVAVRRQSTL